MHYKNGHAAKLGDLVRGFGYNVKHEIIGKLVAAQPEASACNCQVAHVDYGSATFKQVDPDLSDIQYWSALRVEADIEYGQLDAFVAIDRHTGDVLHPEDIA